MEKSEITDIYAYQAIDALLSTSGQPTEAQLAAAARAGFSVVINLALHNDPRYSLRDEASTVKALGMEYIHIPVQFDAPTEAGLLAFFAAMADHRDKKIIAHCAANMRVSAFLGLYRAIRQGQPIEEAFSLMKTIWQPNPVWAAFISDMLSKHRH